MLFSKAGDSRPASHAGPRPGSQASQAVKSLLPLRADVLLSNSLFEDLADGICENFLQYYTGATDLTTVTSLDLQVDTVQEGQQVEDIGELLPNLEQLRLSQSNILTMRDLGTSLRNLRVLWLCRCSLQDLGGVTALPALEELYVSFNDISDLWPLCTHETIQVLDLEGNLIEDISEVEGALQPVSSLRELTLAANPVMKTEDVRSKLLAVLPQLEVLDDIPRMDSTCTHEGTSSSSSKDMDAALADSDDEDVDSEISSTLSLDDEPIGEMPQGSDRPSMPLIAFHNVVAEEEESEVQDGALQKLRQRSDTKETAPQEALSINGFSEAMEALKAARSEVEAATARMMEQESPCKASFEAEPTDQELVVEGLRRGRREGAGLGGGGSAVPSTGGRATSCGLRPATCFAPGDRRNLRSAWSSAGSSSMCRPTTASSGVSTGISGSTVFEDAESCASELTTGGDGSPLAGNPLAAIRRRRHVQPASREDDIRNLLRKFEAVSR